MNKKDITNINLPNNVVAYIKSLEDENSKLNETVKEQTMTIDSLKLMIINSRKKIFGKSSEKIENAEQLTFFNEAETESNAKADEPTEETLVKAYKRKPKRTKEELTENLPHKEVVCKIDEEKLICDDCGEKLVYIGKEKVRSELVIIPEQLFVVDYYREVYKCKTCEELSDEAKIIKAEVPVPVMKKSMASPATVAHVMTEKYLSGVPLYRQEQYWKSNGVELNRNTLANWVIRSSRWFAPLYECMKSELLKEDIVHADETELRVLKRDGKPTSSVSRMWVYCSGKYTDKLMALYQYHPTRSKAVVEDMLGKYCGYLHTDGYAAYNAAEKSKHVGCWAHVRRKFLECIPKGVSTADSKAAQALGFIEKMFAIEKATSDLPPEERQKKRREQIKPVLEAFWLCLEKIHLSDNQLSKATKYVLNNRKALETFLTDGRIEMTNNRAERAVKPFVIGRKNFLFSDTDKGAEASALCYTIIESAKLNNLNVFAYLNHLLSELPKLGDAPIKEQLTPFLPWAELKIN